MDFLLLSPPELNPLRNTGLTAAGTESLQDMYTMEGKDKANKSWQSGVISVQGFTSTKKWKTKTQRTKECRRSECYYVTHLDKSVMRKVQGEGLWESLPREEWLWESVKAAVENKRPFISSQMNYLKIPGEENYRDLVEVKGLQYIQSVVTRIEVLYRANWAARNSPHWTWGQDPRENQKFELGRYLKNNHLIHASSNYKEAKHFFGSLLFSCNFQLGKKLQE